MEEEEIQSYINAGKISIEAKKYARSIAKPGMTFFELAEKIEGKIQELGGKLAFPCNLSFGHVAAHYSPLLDSEDIIPENGILKIDLGVHVNGFIADTAFSIDFSGENENLLMASKEALERAIDIIRPGIKISEISEIIEKTIISYEAKPIRNLTGHELQNYKLHSGLVIPNTKNLLVSGRLKPNIAIAIEPFATNGAGVVIDSNFTAIYSLNLKSPHETKKLEPTLRDFYRYIFDEFKELPFNERYFKNYIDKNTFRKNIATLVSKKLAIGYPMLIESGNGEVAQFEESILILEKEVIPYTKEKRY
ncbi:type II methionyl aminopeptidase [Fervidicoccus fontis]|uniref:Methionine aminopeptidase n=1 Tax=Fervidicoccus fontis (strain DSM 19380 / JCM 18336 / VKM B-2539 / Kam940) TaxID=1163730 RepID=I0A014_FERFK|nr:type II methionyl aminopeptidase [Fervidicoccus fontis]AFH42321.1 metalloaminopeptidase, family M24A [Fervidicoccus fontis Kam940]